MRVFHFKLHELPVFDTEALSPDELSMAKAHADIQDQQMFIACRTALKKILGAALSIPILEVKLYYRGMQSR